MERSLHQTPLSLNPPCPIPQGPGGAVDPLSSMPTSGMLKGALGCRNLPPEISCVLWPVPAASSSRGSGMWSIVDVYMPTGIAAPRHHRLLSFHFLPSLQDLLPAPTSQRPLSWGSKSQES